MITVNQMYILIRKIILILNFTKVLVMIYFLICKINNIFNLTNAGVETHPAELQPGVGVGSGIGARS